MFTNLTIGASSPGAVSASCSFSRLSGSSRSISSSEPSNSPNASSRLVSEELSNLSTAADSLSSSTSTDSTVMPVLNLISSTALINEGSLCATNSRFPRLKRGRIRCFSISPRLTMSLGATSKSKVPRSRTGKPNSSEATQEISLAKDGFC